MIVQEMKQWSSKLKYLFSQLNRETVTPWFLLSKMVKRKYLSRKSYWKSPYSFAEYIWWSNIIVVPDPGSRDRDVVLASVGFAGETQGGSGIRGREGMGREWERGGQFTSNLVPRWTGSHHAKGGFPTK